MIGVKVESILQGMPFYRILIISALSVEPQSVKVIAERINTRYCLKKHALPHEVDGVLSRLSFNGSIVNWDSPERYYSRGDDWEEFMDAVSTALEATRLPWDAEAESFEGEP